MPELITETDIISIADFRTSGTPLEQNLSTVDDDGLTSNELRLVACQIEGGVLGQNAMRP